MAWNQAETTDLESDVGLGTFRNHLGKLARHLLARRSPGRWVPDPTDRRWRDRIPGVAFYAPSIVVRSEIQALNTSTPRFALRARFRGSPADPSIIHVRRLGAWSRYLKDLPDLGFVPRPARKPEEGHPRVAGVDASRATQPLAEALRADHSLSIADCLLTLPHYLSKADFHVIDTDLHGPCGEVSERHVRTTPFAVTALRAGGLCAQVCCFMSTALMHRHARSVYGIADITALATPDHRAELLISGLNPGEMTRYFGKVSLFAPRQSPIGSTALRGRGHPSDVSYLTALRSYLLSNVPVIAIVDARKLAGFYEDNGVCPLVDPEAEEPVLHALLCIGCQRTGDEGSNEVLRDGTFLVHDPSQLPYMRVRGRSLLAAASPDDPREPCHGFLAVHPGPVRLSLLPRTTDERGRVERGLIELSRLHATTVGRPQSPVHHGFLLYRCDAVDHLAIASAYSDRAGMRSEMATFFSPESFSRFVAEDLGLPMDRWVWIERRHEGCCIWDAEDGDAKVADPGDPARHLLAHLAYQGDRLVPERRLPRTPVRRPPPPADAAALPSVNPRDGLPAAAEPITVAAISSLLMRPNRPPPSGIARRWAHHLLTTWRGRTGAGGRPPAWAEGLDGVEVYAFMARDLVDLGFSRRRQHPLPLLGRLERRSGAEEQARRLARLLHEHYGTKPITGFATYVPELRCPQRPVAELASDYFRFLVRVASHLPRTDRRDSPFIIEFVAGSRLDGIWPARLRDDRTVSRRSTGKTAPDDAFGVNLTSRDEVFDRLLTNLQPATDLAQERGGIQFALELEPGPLFALSTFQDLVHIVGRLDRRAEASGDRDSIARLVGLNCDVPHWAFLSDVTMERLLRTPEGLRVRDRIVHAHISDHTEGHWADNPLFTQHESHHFLPWIRLFGELAVMPRPLGLGFSKTISIELEACRHADALLTSIQNLRLMLAQSDGSG